MRYVLLIPRIVFAAGCVVVIVAVALPLWWLSDQPLPHRHLTPDPVRS